MLASLVGRASFAAVLSLAAVASADPFVHLEIGPIVQHLSYRRVDFVPLFFPGHFSPTVARVDSTKTGTGLGAPLRIDLGASISDGVALVVSGEVAYVNLTLTQTDWVALSWSLGVSSIWYPQPRGPMHARLGCAYEWLTFAA